MATRPNDPATASYNRISETPGQNGGSQAPTPIDGDDGIEVHVEITVLDGPEGTRLQELQATAVRTTLRALLNARASVEKGDPR